MASAVLERFSVTPISGSFGATITGIDLATALTPAQADAVRAALDDHKILVFRDQFAVGPGELQVFAANFGKPDTVPHPSFPAAPGFPAVQVAQSDVGLRKQMRDTWHTDGWHRHDPACLTLLQGVDLPPYGRDTAFADMEAAYRDLSEPMKELLEKVRGVFTWGMHNDPDVPPVEHPVIRRHSRTGRPGIYVNRLFTRRLAGLSDAESELLLEYLLSLPKIPEYQLRVSWTPGTIVLWDNELIQHYLVLDYAYPRVMHRVMIE